MGHDCLYKRGHLFKWPVVDFCLKPTQMFHWHSSPSPTDNLNAYSNPTLEIRRVCKDLNVVCSVLAGVNNGERPQCYSISW